MRPSPVEVCLVSEAGIVFARDKKICGIKECPAEEHEHACSHTRDVARPLQVARTVATIAVPTHATQKTCTPKCSLKWDASIYSYSKPVPTSITAVAPLTFPEPNVLHRAPEVVRPRGTTDLVSLGRGGTTDPGPGQSHPLRVARPALRLRRRPAGPALRGRVPLIGRLADSAGTPLAAWQPARHARVWAMADVA